MVIKALNLRTEALAQHAPATADESGEAPCHRHVGNDPRCATCNPGRTVAGSLAAMALRESYDAGNEISVPSLGLTFKKQEPATDEGARGGEDGQVQRPNGVSPDSKTWPYVLAFAIQMEHMLMRNEHKDNADRSPGWLDCWVEDFGPHLAEEVDEVHQQMGIYLTERNRRIEIAKRDDGPLTPQEHAAQTGLVHESADVANMAMMIATTGGGLEPYDEPPADARPAGYGGE